MTDESALALEAGPEVVATDEVASPETAGQPEGQAADAPPQDGAEEEKSASAKRRERERAYKARLQADKEAALQQAADLKPVWV